MRDPSFNTLLLLLMLSFSSACSQNTTVSANEFDKKIKELTDEQVVDVRTPEEFSKGYIDGAMNLNINSPEFEKQVASLDKEKPVLVYCLSGGRSSKAASYMRKQGFRNVIELKGGMMQWKSSGMPVAAAKTSSAGMTLEEFQNAVDSDKLVLVDFYARWCAPCKKMAPDLQALSVENKDYMSLLKVDADQNAVLVDALKIDALPVLMIYKGGKQVWMHSGYLDKKSIQDAISKVR
jgi:thioredoxin 1